MQKEQRTLWIAIAALLFLSFSVFAQFAAAVTVTPLTQQLENPKDEVYQYVFSIANNDPQPHSLELRLEPNSEYLRPLLVFSKEQFALLPGETENVVLRINPQGLGPQTHHLVVDVYEGEGEVGSFALLIVVPGEPTEKYAMSVVASDTFADAASPVTVTLANNGNVIGYATLTLSILRENKVIGSLAYPGSVQILPGKSIPYDLVYTDVLEPGFYTARVDATIGLQTFSESDAFSVRLASSTQRIREGSDLVLTFASLGNPAAVRYTLSDDAGNELLTGTALPGEGDVVVPTSELDKGTYTLVVGASGTEQTIQVEISRPVPITSYAVTVVAALIFLWAVLSVIPRVRVQLRIYSLQREVRAREEELAKLINRAHRLVDRYHTLNGRRTQAVGIARTSDEGLR